MVASSEQHNAPVMVNKPATAHARRSQPGAPLNRDDSAEVIKMPEPIIEPITIIVASIGPSARTRLDCCRLSILLLTGRGGPSQLVMLSEAKHLWLSLVRSSPKSSEILRFAQNDNIAVWAFLSRTFRRADSDAFLFECVRNSRANSTAPGVS